MILCLCPSPAVDVTYRLRSLVPGATNRVHDVAHRPGGKAVNVARVLHTIGADLRLLLPLDGSTGDELLDMLSALAVPTEVVWAGAATRRTIAIIDDGGAHPTMLSEPARVERWEALEARFVELLEHATVAVVSGTLPNGAPTNAVARLVAQSKAQGRPIIVDTSGPALRQAVAAGPTLIKPNRDELAELTGERDPRVAAMQLAAHHHVGVVASLGPEGLLAADSTGVWTARPAHTLQGNPTGAGDALVAGLAVGLSQGRQLAETLLDAVALSAAAVRQPHAGDVDPLDVAHERAGVTVTALHTESR